MKDDHDHFSPGTKIRDRRGASNGPWWRVVKHYDNGSAEMLRLRRVGDDTDERDLRCPSFYREEAFFDVMPQEATQEHTLSEPFFLPAEPEKVCVCGHAKLYHYGGGEAGRFQFCHRTDSMDPIYDCHCGGFKVAPPSSPSPSTERPE